MNSFVVILSCLTAVALASPTPNIVVEYLANGQRVCRQQNCNRINPWNDCPPVNCPPAVRDGNCGAPDCSLPGNRLRLHPHPDPNFFYQCTPVSAVGPLVPLRMPCGCGTLFSAVADENRCVHPAEWRRDCLAQPAIPILSQEFCRAECPTCDDDNGNLPPSPTLPPPLPTLPPPAPTNPPPNGNCPCTCVCIWWPCQPCANNCPCNNNNNNNNVNNQNPWAPQPPQQPWAPQPPQNNPWAPQPPQQPWAPQPPQNNPWQPQPPQNPWDQQRPQWFEVEADVE